MTLRFIFRHIARSKVKTLLCAAVAVLFAVALSWLNLAIARNIHETDRLFDTTSVSFEIMQSNPAQFAPNVVGGQAFDIINQITVERILNGGFIQNHELDTRVTMGVIAGVRESYDDVGPPQYLFHDMERREEGAFVTAFNHTGRITPGHGFVRRQEYIVNFADGWDYSIFAEEWPLERLTAQDFPPIEIPQEIYTGRRRFVQNAGFGWLGINELNIPVIVNQRLKNAHGFSYGDVFFLTSHARHEIVLLVTCVIVGSYRFARDYRVAGIGEILMPLSAFRTLEAWIPRMEWGYSHVRFYIDTARNRELSEIRTLVENIVAEPDAGRLALHTVFWDDELRMAIEPMEQNLQLMQILYPVTLAVSVLISAGLALLLSLLKANISALLRALGASKLRVRFILCFEHFILSLIGLCLGLAIFTAIRGSISPLPHLPPFGHISMYLLGAFIGSLCGAVLVSNRPPLELLQVKE